MSALSMHLAYRCSYGVSFCAALQRIFSERSVGCLALHVHKSAVYGVR